MERNSITTQSMRSCITKEACKNQLVWMKMYKILLCPCKQACTRGQTKEVGVRVLEGKFQFPHETRNSPVGLTSPKARKREERYVYSEMKRATNKRLHVVKMSGLGVGFPRGKLQLD